MLYAPFVPDPNSHEWTRFKGWLEHELQSAYKELAGLETSLEKTQQVRGRAAYIRRLLDLGKGPFTPPPQG